MFPTADDYLEIAPGLSGPPRLLAFAEENGPIRRRASEVAITAGT